MDEYIHVAQQLGECATKAPTRPTSPETGRGLEKSVDRSGQCQRAGCSLVTMRQPSKAAPSATTSPTTKQPDTSSKAIHTKLMLTLLEFQEAKQKLFSTLSSTEPEMQLSVKQLEADLTMVNMQEKPSQLPSQGFDAYLLLSRLSLIDEEAFYERLMVALSEHPRSTAH